MTTNGKLDTTAKTRQNQQIANHNNQHTVLPTPKDDHPKVKKNKPKYENHKTNKIKTQIDDKNKK